MRSPWSCSVNTWAWVHCQWSTKAQASLRSLWSPLARAHPSAGSIQRNRNELEWYLMATLPEEIVPWAPTTTATPDVSWQPCLYYIDMSRSHVWPLIMLLFLIWTGALPGPWLYSPCVAGALCAWLCSLWTVNCLYDNWTVIIAANFAAVNEAHVSVVKRSPWHISHAFDVCMCVTVIGFYWTAYRLTLLWLDLLQLIWQHSPWRVIDSPCRDP